MIQIWIDLEVSNPNGLSQKLDLTEESWRRSLDFDKSCRLGKIRTTNTQFYSPAESPDLLVGIFHLLQTTRCSTGLNGSDPEQIEDRGWRLSLDVVDTWNVMLRLLTCVPTISFNMQTYWNHQNIIYWSMLVTKESNNIHVKSNNNNNVGWKSTCIKIKNGEVYNQALVLTCISMKPSTLIPISSDSSSLCSPMAWAK